MNCARSLVSFHITKKISRFQSNFSKFLKISNHMQWLLACSPPPQDLLLAVKNPSCVYTLWVANTVDQWMRLDRCMLLSVHGCMTVKSVYTCVSPSWLTFCPVLCVHGTQERLSSPHRDTRPWPPHASTRPLVLWGTTTWGKGPFTTLLTSGHHRTYQLASFHICLQ